MKPGQFPILAKHRRLMEAGGVKLPPQPDEAREGSQSPDDGRAPGLTPDHIGDVTDMIPNSNTEHRV